MEHFIYVSSPQTSFTDEELVTMLQHFRDNNFRLEITGLLLYQEGKFMQYLEGPPANLAGLIRRIQTDPRHKNIRVLSEGVISERLFSNWTMGYRSLQGIAADHMPGYRQILDGSEKDDLSALELLTLFQSLSPDTFS